MTNAGGEAGLNVDALIQNLEQQVRGYAALQVLAQRELDGLLGGQNEDLSILLAEQEFAIRSLQELEAARLALLAPLAESMQQTAEELTMTALEPRLPAASMKRLQSLRQQLRETVTALSVLNGQNSRLLTSAARILQRWHAYMVASVFPASTYSESGGLTQLPSARALDEAA